MFSNFVASCTRNGNANTGSAKRLKNEENHADQVMNDDGLIKRIRLDSQDKEKNIQLEMERTVSDRIYFIEFINIIYQSPLEIGQLRKILGNASSPSGIDDSLNFFRICGFFE